MPRLDRNFPGAAADDLRHESGCVRFTAPLRDSPQSMWWHFALQTPDPGTVHCVWENTGQVLGHSGLTRAVPVYCDGNSWRRVPARHCRYLPEQQELHFRVPCRVGRTVVAYCFPYTAQQVERLLEEAVHTGAASVRQIGSSERGRPLRLLEFGQGPTHVWLTARHHAGEVSGAYVLEGLVRETLRRPALLRRATFHVVPAMDLDGVAGGMYGKDRAPRDFNRDYCSPPCRPEVAALMAAADEVGRADLFLDLHAPAPGDGSFLVPVKEPLASLEHWDAVWQLGSYLEAFAPASCPFRVQDLHRDSLNWCSENTMQNSTDYFHRRFEALSATLETTYHRSHDGRLVSPRGWRALGRALAQALAAQIGACRPPDVTAITRPAALVPRLQDWLCVHVPGEVELGEREGSARITGRGDSAHCWLMRRPPPPPDSGGLQWRLHGRVNRVTLTAKGWDPEKNLPTGRWESAEPPLASDGEWRPVDFSSEEKDYLLMVRAEGLDGTLELRPAPSRQEAAR